MSEGSVSERDVRYALAFADGYLTEAENVLWTTAARVDGADVSADLESITQELWAVQHRIHDLQRELDESEARS